MQSLLDAREQVFTDESESVRTQHARAAEKLMRKLIEIELKTTETNPMYGKASSCHANIFLQMWHIHRAPPGQKAVCARQEVVPRGPGGQACNHH